MKRKGDIKQTQEQTQANIKAKTRENRGNRKRIHTKAAAGENKGKTDSVTCRQGFFKNHVQHV